MTKTVDYYFAIQSPYAYLGSRAFEEIAERRGARVNTRPIDLLSIFPETGGLPLPKRAPARQAYRLVELARWSAHRDLPLIPHPKFFPADPTLASRMVIAADAAGADGYRLAHVFFALTWADDEDIADPATLTRSADILGMDGAAIRQAAEADAAKEAYDAYTSEALARGVFGAPTFIVDDEMFWGQDRLDFVDRALA